MRITFIGTSHGVPEPHRKCSCTLIETQGKTYVIDMGCQIIEELVNLGKAPEAISSVFITHSHGDHTNGLLSFIDLLNWHFVNASPTIYMSDPRQAELLSQAAAMSSGPLREGIRFDEVHEGLFYDDGTLKVTAVPTHHMDRAYAFILEAEGKKAAFTGDLKQGDGALVDYPAIVTEPMDLVVCESAHFPAHQYTEVFQINSPKKAVITHYTGPQIREFYAMQAELKDRVPVILATDGLVMEI